MKLRIAGPLLLVPMFLIALNPLSALADTILPPPPVPLVIQEDVEFFWGTSQNLDGGPATASFEVPPSYATVRYTVLNPHENAGEYFPNGPEAPTDTYLYPTIAFGVETNMAGGWVDREVPDWYPSWNYELLSRLGWNGPDGVAADPENGIEADGFAFGAQWSDDGTPFRTDQFGSYEDNFEPDEILAAQVAFYFDNDGTQQAISPGSIVGGFNWSHELGNLNSETKTILIGPNGTPVGLSSVTGTIIPLPSAAWMGLGLMGVLAAIRRRRRAG